MQQDVRQRGRIFEWANRAAAALFVASAALQYNDPDPLPWMLIYGGAAAACILGRRPGPRAWLPPASVGAVSAIWALTLVSQVLPVFRFGDLLRTMKAETPSIELSRELLGLLLIAGWMVVLVLVRPRHPRAGA